MNNQQPNKVTPIVVIQGESGTCTERLLGIRRALLEALVTNNVSMEFVPEFGIDEYVKSLNRSALFVTMDPNNILRINALSDMVHPHEFALVTVAPSYQGFGTDYQKWASELRAGMNESTAIITGSSVSRRIIEEELDHIRADVRVINAVDALPAHHSDYWTFEDFERTDGLSTTDVDGVTWNFAQPRSNNDSGDQIVVRNNQSTIDLNWAAIRSVFESSQKVLGGLEIGIIGTKLTFIDELSRDLQRMAGATVRMDPWKYLSAPSDIEKSENILRQSDVVIGEWARPNNVWIQEHADESKRLILRTHRYEVTTEFPAAIDIDRFDAAVVIVPWVGRKLVQDFGWPASKMVFIPNYVNAEYFNRCKLPNAEFTLGLVGITPSLKRLDLALDLLAALRRCDSRYNLRVRGALPPSHINWNSDPSIPQQWGAILSRLDFDSDIAGAVHFDKPGRDMARWYEKVGIILSTSDLEGSHVALAEGVASGSVPVVRNWPGASTLWPSSIIHDSVEDARDWILESRSQTTRDSLISDLSRLKAVNQKLVLEAWMHLLQGDVEAAKKIFGPIDWNSGIYDSVSDDVLYS